MGGETAGFQRRGQLRGRAWRRNWLGGLFPSLRVSKWGEAGSCSVIILGSLCAFNTGGVGVEDGENLT